MTTKFSAFWPPFVATASLLLLLLTISPTLAHGKLPQKIELEGASFTLSAGLTIKYNDKSTGYYELREFHSAWQWRSRIDYEAAGVGWAFANSRGTFYADDTQAFQVDSIFNRCTRTDQKSINAAFKMDFISAEDNESRHVVGTVRLLKFIERHSEEFQAAAPPDGNGEFSAKIGDLSITVYYCARGVTLPLGVPSRVIVARSDGFQLVLKLMRVALLTPMELVYGDSNLPPGVRQSSLAGYDLLYDVFAAPPGLDCSRGAQSDVDLRQVLGNTDAPYRFTFSARHSSKRGLNYPVPTIVGYEPELETLRVNQRFERHSSQTWVSYRHDRVYTVIGRHGGRGGASIIDTVLDPGANMLQPGQEEMSLSCVVAKASVATKLTDTCRNPHTLGTMLLGAINVVYLGLARVRGIEAHVFEARDSQLPVWLEVPSIYSDDELGQTLKSRIKSSADDEMGVKLTTVFYFSRTRSDHGVNRLLNNKLLLIEIYKMSPAGVQLDKITVPVFEFTWALQTTAPNGQRTEDFYSLGDECLAPPGTDNHYAHISFNLKPTAEPGSEDFTWLRAPVKRNLALMRAVCEQFGVPPTLVYDFESRRQVGAAELSLVWAQMLAAERQEAPVSLVSLGRGTPTFSMFTIVAVSGFQMCYQLASHKRQDTLFAYNGMRSTCYLYRLAMPRQDLPTTSIFRPDKLSNFEMYKVVQRPSRKLVHDDYITKLDEMQARLISTGRVILTNPSDASESLDQRTKVFFSLAQVMVSHLNEKTAYDLDEHHLDDINKFPGLGLVPEDPQMKLVERPKSAAPQDPQQVGAQMTFEQCHEACLIDVECESFSTCIVEGRVECVLSSVDFKASTVVLQLMELRDRQSKLGETFPVSLDESVLAQDLVAADEKSPNLGVVHIKKHPTCELHNKLYRDLFTDAGEMYVNLRDRLLRPVTHPEQCAEFCYLGTLATMRKETRRLRKTLHGDEHDPGLTEGYSAGHCGHYYFLDQQTLNSSRVTIPKEQIISMHTDGATRGYCLFDDGSDEPTTYARRRPGEKELQAMVKNKHAPSQSLLLRKFELDFSVMYEKQYGISLLESKKSIEEKAAYLKIYLERDFSREHLNVMRKFLEQGGNSGHRARFASAQECARRCFTQLTPLWPACRSFEFYEIVEKSNARRHNFCTFNTATINQLTDLGRTDMVVRVGESNGNNSEPQQTRVQVNEGDELRVWHYEPRQGLVASSLRERYEVSMDDSEWELDELSHRYVARVTLSSLSLFIMICALFTVGVAAGAVLQMRTGKNRAREDNEILVEREKDLNLNDMSQDDTAAGANGKGISEPVE